MRRLTLAFACALAGGPLAAAEPGPIAAGPLKAEGRVAFLEGPTWHSSGNVYFSDVENNRIMRRDPKGVMHVFRAPSGRANGLIFDAQERLVMCEGAAEGGNRRVTRFEPDGTLSVLADRHEGNRFNSPNDLDIDSKGRVYFTDPRYNDRAGMEMVDGAGRPIEGVYRIDPDGRVSRILAGEIERPNGIAVSPGDEWLYVVDNNNATPEGNRKIWRFGLTSTGDIVPGSRKQIYDFSPGRGADGMAVDSEGRIYAAAGLNFANLPAETDVVRSGIYVISPEGELLDTILVPEDMITNCAFGGPEMKTLYITAGHHLWSVETTARGFRP